MVQRCGNVHLPAWRLHRVRDREIYDAASRASGPQATCVSCLRGLTAPAKRTWFWLRDNGLKIAESWTRGLSDFTNNTGASIVYHEYIAENGDRFFIQSTTPGVQGELD